MKFGNLDDWHTDPAACTTGVPLELGNGRTLFVRRAGTRNRAFLAAVAGIDSNNETQQMTVYADSIVCGWQGINDDAGEPVPFSGEACLALFQFAPEIFDAVWLFAANRGNFRMKEIDEEKQQVKTHSGGAKAQVRTPAH